MIFHLYMVLNDNWYDEQQQIATVRLSLWSICHVLTPLLALCRKMASPMSRKSHQLLRPHSAVCAIVQAFTITLTLLHPHLCPFLPQSPRPVDESLQACKRTGMPFVVTLVVGLGIIKEACTRIDSTDDAISFSLLCFLYLYFGCSAEHYFIQEWKPNPIGQFYSMKILQGGCIIMAL